MGWMEWLGLNYQQLMGWIRLMISIPFPSYKTHPSLQFLSSSKTPTMVHFVRRVFYKRGTGLLYQWYDYVSTLIYQSLPMKSNESTSWPSFVLVDRLFGERSSFPRDFHHPILLRMWWWENMQEDPIFDGRNQPWFFCRFSHKPISWILPRFVAGHSGDLRNLSSGDSPGRDRERQKHAGAADDFGTGAAWEMGQTMSKVHRIEGNKWNFIAIYGHFLPLIVTNRHVDQLRESIGTSSLQSFFDFLQRYSADEISWTPQRPIGWSFLVKHLWDLRAILLITWLCDRLNFTSKMAVAWTVADLDCCGFGSWLGFPVVPLKFKRKKQEGQQVTSRQPKLVSFFFPEKKWMDHQH